MNKSKTLLLAILLSWAASEAFSDPISTETARQVAKNLHSKTVMRQKGAVPGDVEFLNTILIGDQQNPLMFVFNLPDDEGFIVIAGDDASYPVLCYGLKGNFSADSERRPEGFNLFMQSYERQLTEIRRFRMSPSPENKEDWDRYLVKFTLIDNTGSVDPLLTTTWDQGCWYNAMCPVMQRANAGVYPLVAVRQPWVRS